MSICNNHQLIHGYIGKSVTEIRYTKQGKPFIKISVGVQVRNRYTKEPKTTWFNATIFGDLAVGLIGKQKIVAGYEVALLGATNHSSYMSNGRKVYTHDIIVDWIVTSEKTMDSRSKLDASDAANEIDESISDEEIEDVVPF